MRIIACPSDRNAVGWYRLGLPAQTLIEQDAGIDFCFTPGLPIILHAITEQPIKMADEFYDLEPDVLIMQRPVNDRQLFAIKAARKHGIAVVVELDDDYHTIDKRTITGMQITPQHLRTISEACRNADLVTVSTPALAERYGQHSRCVVLPNYVPESWLAIERQHASCPRMRCVHGCICPVVGWTGSIGMHRSDLEATHGGVGLALTGHPATFRAFGDGNAQNTHLLKRALHLASEPDIQPWQPREQYPHAIARLTIGIAPLQDSAFNRSKSWLKPLEYAACGVPCVMSPSPEYTRLHQDHGIGILAGHRSREWKRAITKLLADPSYRNHVAQEGRQAVRDGLTMEANAWRWAEAWTSAMTYGGGGSIQRRIAA